jgi:hypothetical protein
MEAIPTITPRSHDPLIDRFMPHADVKERHEVLVQAPPEIVFDVARTTDMQSNTIVRGLVWLRAKLLRATPPQRDRARGLVEETRALGWGVLAERPTELVMGAVTQPWQANVQFRAIPPDEFLTFDEPGLVKIVWTLEAEPVDPTITRFRTETRVLATDDDARARFRKYWRRFGIGIVLIRLLLLPVIRREAERRARVLRDPASWSRERRFDSPV